MYRPFRIIVTALYILVLLCIGSSINAESRTNVMSYLDNGRIRLGVNLDQGGSITWLSKSGGENIVNNYDLGRQIQMSHYSGPIPFIVGEKKPVKTWEHIGWNPIQTGDDFDNGSRVLKHRNDGNKLYVKCIPMQWSLNNVSGDCTFESWLELDGDIIKARCRMNNARTDHTQYPYRNQELPAIYLNAPFSRIVSYTGDQPFSWAPLSDIPRPAENPDKWASWLGTECWSAILNDKGWGLGMWRQSGFWFAGGFAGIPSSTNDTSSTATGYLSGHAFEILDHNIQYEYCYELTLGTIEEIRKRAYERIKRPELPLWIFEKDRQGWYYINTKDRGWPINGQLEVQLEKNDPQLVSPVAFWHANKDHLLIINAAFKTRHEQAIVFWRRLGEDKFSESTMISFPVIPDSEFHSYTVPLGKSSSYQGTIIQLRFDPVPDGSSNNWVRIKSIAIQAVP